MKCLKGYFFKWTYKAEFSFQFLKRKMTKTFVLTLLKFKKLFKVNCDAFGIGIKGVINQDRWPNTLFNKKLSSSKKNYYKYDIKFYVII